MNETLKQGTFVAVTGGRKDDGESRLVLGWLMEAPSVGRPLRVFRLQTDSRVAMGYFCTSPIVALETEVVGSVVYTENSRYVVKGGIG